MRVAVFTDTDFDTMNGATTTLRALVRHAPADVRPRIYTSSAVEIDEPDYLALRSPELPAYDRGAARLYLPPIRELYRRLIADDVRVIHMTNAGPSGLAARYLAHRSGLPLVGSVHTDFRASSAAGACRRQIEGLQRQLHRWAYSRCERVLVPSAEASRRLGGEEWGRERLTVWPRGVDSAMFSPLRRSRRLRESWHVSQKRPAILYVGRLTRDHGLALIEPLGSLLYQQGIPHRFILVGDGEMMPELAERCPDAVFTGALPHHDIAPIMASADVFLYPSDAATAGTVVLEAQSSGLPVVVADGGGARENMRVNVTGSACRTGDAMGFCARVAELLTDTDRRKAIGESARRYASSRSWQVSLDPVYDLYRESLHRQHTHRPITPSSAMAGVTPGPVNHVARAPR